MRSFCLTLFLIFIAALCFAQNVSVKSTEKYLELINKHVENSSLKQKDLGSMSKLGGTVTGYYLNKKLVLITTSYGGQFGYIDHSFYMENDSLVYVNEKKIILKEPETEKEYEAYEKYVIFNTDKNGKTDLTKWPLTVNISNAYYFGNGQIVKYRLKSFDKTVKPFENEIERAAKDLIYRYHTHCEELR